MTWFWVGMATMSLFLFIRALRRDEDGTVSMLLLYMSLGFLATLWLPR